MGSPSLAAKLARIGLALLPALMPIKALAQDTGQQFGQEFGQVVSTILVVDREKLFVESAFGKSITTFLTAERSRLEAETRQIEAELEVEEQALTEIRDSLSPEEFRAQADAFDARVQTLREERDIAQEQLRLQIEKAQLNFLEQVTPILAVLMQEAGASVLVDRRVVLISAASIDITAEAISRIDAAFAEASGGSGQTTPDATNGE